MIKGLKKIMMQYIYTLLPMMYMMAQMFLMTLCFMLFFSPIFLKDHKEYNIFFYLHSGFSTFNLMLYILVCMLFFFYFLTKNNMILEMTETLSMYGIFISLFSLVSGLVWGYYSWGKLLMLDNKTYLMMVMFFVYLFTYMMITSNSLIKKNSSMLLFMILISFPAWKLLSTWWSTLHQSFSISLMGTSFPNSLLFYFFMMGSCVLLSLLMAILNKMIISLVK